MTEILTLPDLGAVVELRPARLADVYAAVRLVPVPLGVEASQPLRIAYQMEVDDIQVLHQVESLDGAPVTDALALACRLTPDDMAALRQAAEGVKKKPKPMSEPSATGEPSKPD